MEFGSEFHTNVWGPVLVESRGGKHYYVMYTNDKTWLTHVYFLTRKEVRHL